MQHGFVKIATATPAVTVADCKANAQAALTAIDEATSLGARIIVLPELCLTGYTCGDLFEHAPLLDAAEEALTRVLAETAHNPALIAVGLPVRAQGKLFNVAAFMQRGSLLALIPKTNIPSYNEFYEARNFAAGQSDMGTVALCGFEVPLGTDILLECTELPELVVAAELCEDLWVPAPPSVRHALAGATLICNLSASPEAIGKNDYRLSLVSGQSARLVCAYAYTTAGQGESTTDLVFGGKSIIAENGAVLARSNTFENEVIATEIDVQRLVADRRRMTTFPSHERGGYKTIPFSLPLAETELTRSIASDPFVPKNEELLAERCEEILSIQAQGLRKRLEHTRAQHALVGISGGLDSTLALLVTARAFDLLGLERTGIVAVTMPGFGTTDRTHDNARKLVQGLGATFRDIPIGEAVLKHFQDIGHDAERRDVTYENAQARERTQVLMDLANQLGGLVVGTGDLSELALGWATYNGDHMSMYGVNAGVPKTLVRHLVDHYARTCDDAAVAAVLLDVLDTPVSPELLPPENGQIAQRTEDIVGPYELHDFFLYHMLRFGFAPSKIFRLAKLAFSGTYDAATILKWQRVFTKRFFQQQFKRSCLPDGPKIGSIALSPRGDLRMPSDASARIWLDELDKMKA